MHKRKKKNSRAGTKRAGTVRHSAASASTGTNTQAPASDRPPYQLDADERGRIIWARGAEDQDRGAVHYHAVLARTTGIAPFAAMKLWERIGGGSARVVPYDATQRGVFYISKEGDVDVSATWFGDA